MPNKNVHALIGGFSAALLYIIDRSNHNQEINFFEGLGCFIVGSIAGCIPDIIEPANDPNHRGICHSVVIGSIPAAYLVNSFSDTKFDKYRWIKQSAAIGFTSHLMLDGITPKGLPLLV